MQLASLDDGPMDSRRDEIDEIDDQSTLDSTPEDVSALYSWANLRGAKYRDYSASRREYRAQVRYRAARTLLEFELAGQVEAEAAATKAERAAFEAQPVSEWHNDKLPNASQSASYRSAEDGARLALSERMEAARRAESAARAGVLALSEEREIAEAHASALRQALAYEESERRRSQLAGPQPYGPVVDTPADPNAVLGLGPVVGADASTPAWLTSSQSIARTRSPSPQAMVQSFKADATGEDTLQDLRERVAARWFALKGLLEHAAPEHAAQQPPRAANNQTPMLALFSLVGGVGKTSLVATLGRALASQGEMVTLVDTTSHGLLGIYFGSPSARVTAVRTAQSTTGSTDPPITLVSHGCAEEVEDDRQRDTDRDITTEDLLRNGEGSGRLLLDISTGSSWLIRRLVDIHPTVLVPITPDMNSVISLQAVERLFRGFMDAEGRPLSPFYVLNQFDSALPLHLDVREVFRRQLGERLLRVAIRRSPAVAEALADGMTVLDYASDAAVSQDYRDIAAWLSRVSPSTPEESRRMRGEER